MGRFELLQLIYRLKKSNEELTLRLRDTEKQLDTLKRDSAQREEKLSREFEQRLDEIRMQGAAKDLQTRLKKIEQQLLSFQLLAEKEAAAETEESAIPQLEETDLAQVVLSSSDDPPVSRQDGE